MLWEYDKSKVSVHLLVYVVGQLLPFSICFFNLSLVRYQIPIHLLKVTKPRVCKLLFLSNAGHQLCYRGMHFSCVQIQTLYPITV